jgi:tRNA(Ile)-lysidine synthase
MVASVDKEYLTGQAQKALATLTKAHTDDEVLMDGERLRNLGKPVRRRVIAAAFKEIGLVEDMTFMHFEDADDIIFSSKPSARLDLPHGYYLTKVYDDVRAAAGVTGALMKCRITEVTKEEYDNMNLTKGDYGAFDADEIKGQVQWRSRREGDYIAIKGGNKKLQDLFVDQKIPRDQRDKICFAAAGREVIFLPAAEGILDRGRYSVNYPVNTDTKKVILIEIIR